MDLDGTCLETGATAFPPGFVEKLEKLHQAGVRIIFATGKPEEEIRELITTLPLGLPISFIYERTAYRIDRHSSGRTSKSSPMTNEKTESASAGFRQYLLIEERQKIQKEFNITLGGAGSGTHKSMVSIDIFKPGITEDDIRKASPNRMEIKEHDENILRQVKQRIEGMLLERGLADWEITDMRNSNFEIHPKMLQKELGIVQTAEFSDKPGRKLMLGDSPNDKRMLDMNRQHMNVLSGVVYNRRTPPDMVAAADFGVAGEATADIVLGKIIRAKGIGQGTVVVSNTAPVEKTAAGWQARMGAPIGIRRAVESIPNARMITPHLQPDSFDDMPDQFAAIRERYVPVALTRAQHQSQYERIANELIWKAMHANSFALSDIQYFSDEDWDRYLLVSRNLARQAEIEINGHSSAVVWVHDFQVAPVGAELRRMHPEKTNLGFFWHIPFPDANQFIARMGSKQRAKQFIGWMSAYDVIGFHTERYAANYVYACSLLGIKPARTSVQPISVDVDGIHQQAKAVMADPDFRFELPALNDIYDITTDTDKRVKVVLNGMERADPIKGTVQRLEAIYELAADPDNHELFKDKRFLEVFVASRLHDPQYRNYVDRCARLLDNINDALGHKQVMNRVDKVESRKDVFAAMAHARYAMFTSLDDGFNMSAAEVLNTWNATKDTGIERRMILSDRTGLAQSLAEKKYHKAVSVFDPTQMKESIRELLADEVPQPDYDQVGSYFDTYTIQKWAQGQIRAIRDSDTSGIRAAA